MTKPSVSPATTSHGAVPRTSITASRACRRSDSARGSVPASIIAQPRRKPAAPETAMQESSSMPCGAMYRSSTEKFPLWIAIPAIAPIVTPL